MESLKVKDYMTLQAVTFKPEMSLSAALGKVMGSDYLGGPVINENKEVIGFLSGQDLLDKLIKVSYFCQDTHIVSDCMSTEVLSVSSDMSVIELAEMMQIGKPKVYPVIDSGKLVGIITRKDVLRAIAKNIDECFKHPV
ncbi:CBS domain-containing protein [Vibrio sp. 404]|uniref:CBS domain-containing protein n=1 Tax=Vibrio marinisediminis TaxID=2758441 RepID=A0A7W2FPQ0_9VIBR|nr:CBS domain-containing protein [Vibrio marinisediminis]MBA5762001.1 CBS domain-containing protein [Vibrio marinisediminis]